jgi:TonB family protein
MSTPSHSLLRPQPTAVWPYLAASVVGHLVAVGLFLAWSAAFSGPSMDLEQKPIKASLVRLGKKREEKLLPRKEEPPPPPPKEEKVVEVKAPTPVPEPAAVKIPSKDAKDAPKPKDKTDGAKDARKNLFAAFDKTARAGKVEEPEGEEDGDKNGDAAKAEGERYFALLQNVVHRNYDVSDTIAEGERRTLKAQVALRIGVRGELLDVQLAKSSGNQLFDDAVVGAIKKAAPFAPPPDHLRDGLKKDGVAFVFTP